MVGHGAKFGRKKEEAIAALLVQRNVEEAARSIGVATQTLVRWMKVPEFQIAYREARRAAFSQATARLQQAMSAAVTTLLKLAVDPNAPAAVKARAAYYILTLATKAMETDDIDARVLALERAAELTNQGSMNLTPQPESQW
jgi:transposase-like protein